MKKIFTTALLAMLGAGAFAQTSQGTVSVQGSVNLRNEMRKDVGNTHEDRNSYWSLNISPYAGYFVKDGLELGVGVGLYRYTSKYKQSDGNSYSRSNEISLRPYIRKYIPITENLQLHGTGYAAFGLGNQTSKSIEDSSPKVLSTSTDVSIGIYPGLTYFATPKLGLTATFGSLSYSRRRNKPKEDTYTTNPVTYNTFTANLSPSSVSIGIGYFIAR